MRITNKIMQNNSIYNINNNKVLQDKLSTELSTNKKITRPSDDPVVAIRALRLRSNVSELVQYSEKNAKDGQSWLEVTGKALSTVSEVVTDLSRQANKGANKDLTASDLSIIVEQMKNLRDEFYATGNSDYAGRYVFTGYRTDTTMSFTESELEEQKTGYPKYSITEQFDGEKFDTINYTYQAELAEMTATNYEAKSVTEQDVINSDIKRLRLAYDDITADGTITISTAKKEDGSDVNTLFTPTKVSLTSNPDPYKEIQEANKSDMEKVVFIPETGEVLFSDKAYEKATDFAKTNKDYEFRVTYNKDSWVNGDLRPEHYFACTKTGFPITAGAEDTPINYNQEYLQGEEDSQIIEYDVGYNQTIQVNTRASEVFTAQLDRDIDDLDNAMKELMTIENLQTLLKNARNGKEEGTTDWEELNVKLEAAEKAYSYIREKVHNLMEHSISSMHGYLDDTNVAITANGTRSERLNLIQNRLVQQKTTFQTLQSDNEDIDMSEVAVQLTSVNLSYSSALAATGKILQNTLMNYI